MQVVAHCRAGFEGECALDLASIADRAGLPGERRSLQAQALAAVELGRFDWPRWARAWRQAPPVFVRSAFLADGITPLPNDDRVTPIVAAAERLVANAPLPRGGSFAQLWMETADTNDGKSLSALARGLQPHLLSALAAAGLLASAQSAPPRGGWRLHVLLTDRQLAHVGVSDDTLGSPWPMGIPRLRMPHAAPSRSARKLAEAFLVFLGDEPSDLLRAGMRAVDLGAAPGGWSWQLAERGLRVTAVDNGALKGAAADDPLITHVREDGFHFRPRRAVDWMVCDIVDKPAKVALLAARWIAEGHARRCIFNLKLPMKRRHEATAQCTAIVNETMRAAGTPYTLGMRQLYHDREEITAYLAQDR